jgi:predicted nucleotidyltransferase
MVILQIKYNTGLSSELIAVMAKIIVNHVSASKILIYGSRARGDFKTTSDIDIAVECDDDTHNVAILNEILNEESPTLLKCEVVDFKKVGEKLKKEILREGIVVYEKT